MDLVTNPRYPAIFFDELYGRQETHKLGPTAVYCFTLQGVDVMSTGVITDVIVDVIDLTLQDQLLIYDSRSKYKVLVLSIKLMQYEYNIHIAYLTKKLTIS